MNLSIAGQSVEENSLDEHRASHRHYGKHRSAGVVDRILWWEPLWLALLAPVVLFPGRFWPVEWQPWLVLLLFLFWPVRLIAHRHLSIPSPVNLALWVLLVGIGIGLWTASSLRVAAEAAGYLLVGVTFYVALVNWRPAQRRPTLVAWLLLTLGAVVGVVGLLLVNIVPAKLGVTGLAQGGVLSNVLNESVNPNVLAGALVVVTPLSWALVISRHWTSRQLQYLWAVYGTVVLAEILLLQSRGALLAAGIGLFVVLVLRWRRTVWMGIPLAMIAVVILTPGSELSWLMEIGSSNMSASAAQTIVDRTQIWQYGASAFIRYPFTGLGLGHFTVVMPLIFPQAPEAIQIATHTHNLYIQVGLDLGAVGLAAYIAILILVFVQFVRSYRASLHHGHHMARTDVHALRLQRALAAGGIGAMVGFMIHGLLDAPLWGSKVAWMPWVLFALATNQFLAKMQTRRKREEPTTVQSSTDNS